MLEELYYGNISPTESFIPTKHPDYQKNIKIMLELMEYFEKKLTKDDNKILDDLISAHSASSSICEKYLFIYGFKLASSIWHEVFSP